jgi:hypothetical protein
MPTPCPSTVVPLSFHSRLTELPAGHWLLAEGVPPPHLHPYPCAMQHAQPAGCLLLILHVGVGHAVTHTEAELWKTVRCDSLRRSCWAAAPPPAPPLRHQLARRASPAPPPWSARSTAACPLPLYCRWLHDSSFFFAPVCALKKARASSQLRGWGLGMHGGSGMAGGCAVLSDLRVLLRCSHIRPAGRRPPAASCGRSASTHPTPYFAPQTNRTNNLPQAAGGAGRGLGRLGAGC